MKLNQTALACALGTALVSTGQALAEESPHSLSANIAGTTNYMFRGISQTGNSPAVQGGFDYEYTPFGLYLGVWGSNVKSSGFGGASLELDIYGGWAPTWDKFGLDIGITGDAYMIWGVFAPGVVDDWALAGRYGGASAEASAGVGAGANALFGGDNITLQPLSVQVQTGINAALGVTSMTLDPAH